MHKSTYCIRIIVFLLVVFPITFQAQTFSESTRFKHLSVSDGLSDNYVGAVLQDKEGFMWIGTSDGLNKYDGYTFTIYRHNPIDTNSIGPGGISCIYEDKEGLLWIGTSGSLNVLNKQSGKFKVYKNNPKDSTSLSHNQVTDVIEDKQGNIWVSTYGGGLNKFDKKTGKFKPYKNDPNNPHSISSDNVQNCFEDANGILWIATFGGQKGGLNSFDKKSGKFTFYPTEGISFLIWKVEQDSDGLIWIGNNIGGLCAFDKEKKQVIKQFVNNPKDKNSISDNRPTWLCHDSKGYLWVGTFNGLNVLDKKTGKFTVFKNDPNNSTSISNNTISKIYKDNQGLIWICTSGGINIYDENNNKFVVFKNNPKKEKSLTHNIVYSIYEDSKGVIWMATKNGGVSSYNKALEEFNFYKGEIIFNGKKTQIPPIAQIQELDGELYLAPPSNNLLRFNRSTHKYSYLDPPFYRTENTPGFIYNILVDSKKTLWVGNPIFLYNIDFRNKKITPFKNDPNNPNSISENFTHSFFEDSESNIWVSTANNGINVYERRSGKFFCFKNELNNPNSINNNVVNAVYQAPNGVFWLGTNGGGLNALVLQGGGKDKYTADYKFYHFTEKDGLPNNVIYGILPDNDGNLWISTNNGLCKFTPPTYLSLSVKEYLNKVLSDIKNDVVKNDVPIFKNYDKSDGLPNNSFTGAMYKAKDGEMYMGTLDGLLSFYPNTIKDNSHKPPVYFTSFKLFEKEFALDTPITSKKQITLSYQQSFFSFEFVALDYAQPSKNQYAYMMEGFDSTWVHIGNRQYASYTNLDPGEYIFRVKASNNNGVWNEEGASMRIVITPPFWRTKLFYAICILFVIVTAYLYIKWRERKLIEEKRVLEDEVAKRTKEVVEEKEKVELAHFEIIQKNKKIETAYAIIEDKNLQITDSINYAMRIQQAILPAKEEIYSVLPQSFILYKPKDIVSGDFYFFVGNKKQNISSKNEDSHIFIAAADCTGHGVPGAFMSMIGSEKLNDAVQQSKIPGEILMLINKGIKTTLRQSENDGGTHDGMDIAFCTLDVSTNKLLYAGANRPLIIIRNGSTEVEEIKPTKNAIGGFTENNQHFETHEIQLQTGDTFYMCTDGYADQFGGERGKKFTTKQFKQLLSEIQNKTMLEQGQYLNTTIDSWSKNTEQVDDILVIGIRI
jgi:ligand-binding sensor domain-containing protein/serine phosphatase RsbU (regulator of sigma subunit)